MTNRPLFASLICTSVLFAGSFFLLVQRLETLEAEVRAANTAASRADMRATRAETAASVAEAAIHLERAKGQTDYVDAWAELALVKQKLERVSVAPEPAELSLVRAQLLMAEGKVDEAVVAAAHAARDEYQRLQATLTMAEAFAKKGDWQNERVALEEATRKFPRDVRSVHAFAEFLERQNDNDAAAAAWQQVAVLFRKMGDVTGERYAKDRQSKCMARGAKQDP